MSRPDRDSVNQLRRQDVVDKKRVDEKPTNNNFLCTNNFLGVCLILWIHIYFCQLPFFAIPLEATLSEFYCTNDASSNFTDLKHDL